MAPEILNMRYQQIDIRKKILIPIILISLAGGIVSLALTFLVFENQADANLQKELTRTRYAVTEAFRDKEKFLVTAATALSHDPAIRNYVQRRDKNELLGELKPAKANFGISGVKIVDPALDEIISLGSDFPVQQSVLEAGLSLSSTGFFVRSNDELWMVAICPVRSQQESLTGMMVIGERIDRSFLSAIKGMTGVDIVAEYGGLFVGSTAMSVDVALKDALNDAQHDASTARIISGYTIAANSHLIDHIDLSTKGGSKIAVHALLSTASNNQARKSNLIAISLISLISLFILIVVTYIVSNNITRPLKIMSTRARLIADGNYKQRISYIGIREIDNLATSFNVMSESLETTRQILEERAYTDSLSGLFNHRYFQDNLSSELARTERYGHPLSLIVMDIDDFKKVNDTFGHKKGDMALQFLAEKLKGAIRDTDIACRIGGEEFAIILPETTANEAYTVAERLRLDVASQPVEDIGRITISLGISTVPDSASDKDSLIESADTAMYQAKARGKNQTITYGGQPPAKLNSEPQPISDESYYTDVLYALVAKIEAKDKFEAGHAEHVAALASIIGQELGLPIQDIEHLRVAGRLHDIGKVTAPDKILRKTEALTDEEFKQLRLHPVIGELMLTRTRLEPVQKAVLYHHERLDGSGYPFGIKGDEIPLLARIIAVADSFEVMISDKPWRDALSVEDAIEELKRTSDIRLDKKSVDALARVIERDDALRDIIKKRVGSTRAKSA